MRHRRRRVMACVLTASLLVPTSFASADEHVENANAEEFEQQQDEQQSGQTISDQATQETTSEQTFMASFDDIVAKMSTNTFTDVGNTHRANAEIYYLYSGEIVNGKSSTQFAPDEVVTRGEAAAMIGRALSLSGERTGTEFSDVGSGNFASGYIQAAADRGIIFGYPNNTFRASQPVNRGEMAIMLSRAFAYGADSLRVATQVLMEKGISDGKEDGTFGEKESIKRADFAVFLARSVLQDLRTKPGQQFVEEYFVDATALNFRMGPTTNFASVAQLSPNDKVKAAYPIGNWYFVQDSAGRKGFVHRDYLSKTEVGETEEPKPGTSEEKTIVLDPGHGGYDSGANSAGYSESEIVLDVGLKVKKWLDKTPFNIEMTRDTDKFISLSNRSDFANNLNADLFVSIHANSFNGSAEGTETYYYTANERTNASKALSTYIQYRLLEAWNLRDRGVKTKSFAVIRETSMPATLLELGFIDNEKDREKLMSSTERDRIAKYIAIGILDYYYQYEGLDVRDLYDEFQASPSPKRH